MSSGKEMRDRLESLRSGDKETWTTEQLERKRRLQLEIAALEEDVEHNRHGKGDHRVDSRQNNMEQRPPLEYHRVPTPMPKTRQGGDRGQKVPPTPPPRASRGETGGSAKQGRDWGLDLPLKNLGGQQEHSYQLKVQMKRFLATTMMAGSHKRTKRSTFHHLYLPSDTCHPDLHL